jgi:WD40 repeat protein
MHPLRVWDAESGQQRKSWAPPRVGGLPLAVSPDGRTIATHYGDKQLAFQDLDTGQTRLQSVEIPEGVTGCVAFSLDSSILAAGARDGTIWLLDTATGRPRATLRRHWRGILCLAFSPDGKTLASGDLGGTVKLWNVVTGQELLTLDSRSGLVVAIAFSPDGKTLATGGERGRGLPAEVCLWPTGIEP